MRGESLYSYIVVRTRVFTVCEPLVHKILRAKAALLPESGE